MDNFFNLLLQNIGMGCIACTPLYFGLPKPRTWLFPKLVAVFVASQILLSIFLTTTGDPGKDWASQVVGPMVFAYLAGKFLFTKASRID